MTDDPSYWKGDIYITGGKAFGVAANGDTVCLGDIATILPVAQGAEPIPTGVSYRARAILQEIRGENEIGRIEESPRGNYIPRGSRGRAIRSR